MKIFHLISLLLLPLEINSLNILSSIAQKQQSQRFKIRNIFKRNERSTQELKKGIANFYDSSSPLWESMWGEHMHHGYYVPANRTDHQQAQIDLIDEVLKWSYDKPSPNLKNKRMVDVGCGIGGSSRYITKSYELQSAKGITLSPYQANRGNELALEQNVPNTQFQVADALEMPFEENSFDLVWSLESGEHMPNKPKFVNELLRVCAPNGRIILVTWCHRNGELTPKEERLLNKINRAYYLPQWCSVEHYVDLLQKSGQVKDIRTEDWSYIIAPFWKAVIKSSLSIRGIWGLLKSGLRTQRGAIAMLYMLRGFHKGLIKFGLITAVKKDFVEKDNEF